ncbi:MAG: PKD domain-containing protein, partial [Bacteroidetes bacterium]|nr:PKD domain-containing protein [Bacteroidota bacterium]
MKRGASILLLFFLLQNIYSQSYEMDAYNGQTVSTCSGTFYDSGGNSGQYGLSENYQVTFCSSQSGSQIQFQFSVFSVENGFEIFSAYEGTGTGGTLLGTWTGTQAQGVTVSSISSGCVTFTFTSDGIVTDVGWVAAISCTFPCQSFNADIAGVSVPYSSGDTIDVCQGQSITFSAAGTYPNNGTTYTQSDATTSFCWDFGDGTSTTAQTVTHSFPDPGGYFVELNAYDVNGCDNSNYEANVVRVSTSPTFTGTDIVEDTVCQGETIHFSGQTHTEPWQLAVPPPYSETTFLPDNSSGFYQTAITYEIFDAGQTLTDIYDLESVCLNMEHSYLGDLTIQLICPNGQSVDMIVYPNGCGMTYLGEPIDVDSDLNPGVGYDYCWTPTATNGTWDENCGSGSTLPAGNYEAESSWSNLIGCPLNGDWQIYVFDNLASDNGYIFWWMINFDPSIIPSNLMEFENTYDPADYIWSGNNITSQSNGTGTAVPNTSGTLSYTFTATDDFGCQYDTTVSVIVLPPGSPDCCSIPTPDAGPDDDVCAMTYQLSATLTAGNTGYWT